MFAPDRSTPSPPEPVIDRALVSGGSTAANPIAPDDITDGTSEAQTAANRANAEHSTGPRTPEGKARSRANAVKHGLYVQHVELAASVLDDEPEQLDALKADLLARWRPHGAEEEWIVDRMAATWWELARFHLHNHRAAAEELEDPASGLFPPVARAANRGAVEARFERALTRLRKDLAFLQRYRPHEESRGGNEEMETRKSPEPGNRFSPRSADAPDPVDAPPGRATPRPSGLARIGTAQLGTAARIGKAISHFVRNRGNEANSA